MGNYINRGIYTERNSKDIIDKIEKIDKNMDGVISREEFNNWKKNELQDIINNKINFNNEIDNLKKLNNELKKELENKDKTICDLMNQNINNIETPDNIIKKSISKEQIEIYISKIMNANNISYLPDVVEKQLYKNVFNLLLDVVGSVSFELIGHKVNMSMSPNHQ